jgi:hypothetical protein
VTVVLQEEGRVTSSVMSPAPDLTNDNVLYHSLPGSAPLQGLGHSSGMAILRSSGLPSRDVAQWLCFTLRRFSYLTGTGPHPPKSLVCPFLRDGI